MQRLVYDPKLTARLNERYREFETREMIKRLREIKKRATRPPTSARSRKPQAAA